MARVTSVKGNGGVLLFHKGFPTHSTDGPEQSDVFGNTAVIKDR
jgi:hypothetical protein